MAIGDDAQAAGFPLVPNVGEEGRVHWGAREINRTRDFIALVKALLPVGKSGYRAAAGISYGTEMPGYGEGSDGDIYFRIMP